MARRPLVAPAPDTIEESRGIFRALQAFGIVATLALLAAAYFTWSTALVAGVEHLGIGPGLLLADALFAWFSFGIVKLNHRAAALFFGKPLALLNAGPQYMPLMRIVQFPRDVQEFQAPAEPEKIFKGDDKEELPKGMVRPIRVVTRAARAGEKQILDAQMTFSVSFVVQWVVSDLLTFLANIGSQENVERQLRDIGEATLAEAAADNTPRRFIEKLHQYNEEIRSKIGARFKGYGVEILSVRQIAPDLSHGVSDALANIPKAAANAQATITTAEGEKQRRKLEGEGEAAARATIEKQTLEARAAGQKEMMTLLGVDGETVIAAETARHIQENTDVIIAGAQGGIADLIGMFAGARAGLNSTGKKGGAT